jgi:hypothetical protein
VRSRLHFEKEPGRFGDEGEWRQRGEGGDFVAGTERGRGRIVIRDFGTGVAVGPQLGRVLVRMNEIVGVEKMDEVPRAAAKPVSRAMIDPWLA